MSNVVLRHFEKAVIAVGVAFLGGAAIVPLLTIDPTSEIVPSTSVSLGNVMMTVRPTAARPWSATAKGTVTSFSTLEWSRIAPPSCDDADSVSPTLALCAAM